MRAWILAGALGAALATGATAEPIGRVSAIHVAIGPKLRARARLLSADELASLQNALEDDVQGAFEDAGLTGPGGARVALTIVDAEADGPAPLGRRRSSWRLARLAPGRGDHRRRGNRSGRPREQRFLPLV
jgi:hypothetical protein